METTTNGQKVLTGLDELVDGGDVLACERCQQVQDAPEAGEVCEFHRGWAAGWDACTGFVARVVEEQRAAEAGGGGEG